MRLEEGELKILSKKKNPIKNPISIFPKKLKYKIQDLDDAFAINFPTAHPIKSPLSNFIPVITNVTHTNQSTTETMAKKAVLIGCNYQGTKAELKGCINDVKRMHACLIQRFGFSDDDITVLIDTDDSYTQPTGKNVRKALSDLIRSAEPGDILFVHYSGHGTRLPAETGEDDDTGYDECIVPTDMNLITGNLMIYFNFV